MASDEKLYEATAFPSGTGNGTIYKGTTGGGVTDLYNWGSGTNLDGGFNNLLQATNGNFYGARQGGAIGNQGGIYELTSTGVYSSFLFDLTTKPFLGVYPSAPLMQHTNGKIFGTNSQGGSPFPAEGTFFSLNIGASPFISLVTPVPAGKEGTQVGILGQGFSSSSVVKFGGTAATTRQLTGSTFILATVPAGRMRGRTRFAEAGPVP
jgi:IPT/TIG domain